jgi:hypothetical protein
MRGRVRREGRRQSAKAGPGEAGEKQRKEWILSEKSAFFGRIFASCKIGMFAWYSPVDCGKALILSGLPDWGFGGSTGLFLPFSFAGILARLQGCGGAVGGRDGDGFRGVRCT